MIEEIRGKIARNLLEFIRHAVNESIIRHISVQELRSYCQWNDY
jgi:hypothetical protein